MDRPRPTMMPAIGTLRTLRRMRGGGRGALIGVIAAAALTLTACDGSLTLPSGLGSNLPSLPPLPTLPNRSTEPTAEPTPEPTPEPTAEPTPELTPEPTPEPTAEPTPTPTPTPTPEPTPAPTPTPTPTLEPTPTPTAEPTPEPTDAPSAEPSESPSAAPTAEPSAPAVPSDPVSDSTPMIILLILVLGGIAAALVAWILRQRSAETDDPEGPDGQAEDPTSPIVDPTESVAIAGASTVNVMPEALDAPEASGDEAAVAADPSTDPAQDLAAPPTDQLLMSDETQTPPTVGDDDPTSSFRTGPGA